MEGWIDRLTADEFDRLNGQINPSIWDSSQPTRIKI